MKILEWNNVEIKNPNQAELGDLINILKREELDLRRLERTSKIGYPSIGKNKTMSLWCKTKRRLINLQRDKIISPNTKKQIVIQISQLLKSEKIPEPGKIIVDPFNLSGVEKRKRIDQLREEQILNILIAKYKNNIIASGRVLPVEGSWEIVSLVTIEKYRNLGIASRLIDLILKKYKQRPLYSFQEIELIPFYLKRYSVGDPYIPEFNELPKALQRDLFYMNTFWGTYTIIKIPN